MWVPGPPPASLSTWCRDSATTTLTHLFVRKMTPGVTRLRISWAAWSAPEERLALCFSHFRWIFQLITLFIHLFFRLVLMFRPCFVRSPFVDTRAYRGTKHNTQAQHITHRHPPGMPRGSPFPCIPRITHLQIWWDTVVGGDATALQGFEPCSRFIQHAEILCT